ncbi:MAG: enoyl-CoA hydratase-related protein [Bacteroidetes bacterium]|nr:enoyl-CoA hydratase-related protein [Bacteroidota bacterium]MDA0873575.1 enoyl-CoA hydratase-related protein [Bacteroidota bacterium]
MTLNRPEKRNALDRSLVLELDRVFRALGSDDFVRVIVLTGAGPTFSAGADLEALAALADASDDDNLEDSRALSRLFQTMRLSPKVIIARVNGHAIAGGSGLVAACDMAVAVRRARFGFTEVGIGFVPALVSVLLQLRLKESHLRDLLLTGRLIEAEEAVSMGLISKAVEEEQIDGVIREMAESVARNTSSEAVARTKALLGAMSTGLRVPDMELAERANADARRSADCLAGVRAFLSKDQAPWVRSWDAENGDPA